MVVPVFQLFDELLHTDIPHDESAYLYAYRIVGYGTNVIAYIGHTTPGTIRKRKDRIKKKLPTDFCDIIFGGKG